MSVPTHGTNCSSKAFPTNCFLCNQEVFYFFCSCGSKVLFDELGSPWPIHRCFDDKTSSILDNLMDVYGTIDQTTLNHLKIYAKGHQLEFNKKQLEIIENYLKRGNKSAYHIEVKPESSPKTVVGVITNINKNINFYKRFKMPYSNIATQLLGVLGKDKFNEINVLVKQIIHNEVRNYKVLIPTSLSSKLSLHQKLKIAIRIDVYEVPGKPKAWIITEIDILDC